MPIINFGGLLGGGGSVFGTDAKREFNLDGDYSKAFPVGLPVPTYPFLNQGDTETVIFRQPFEQSLTAYKPLDLKVGYKEVKDAYPLGDVNFRDGQGGVVTFDRQFGNIPKQRVRRGQSHRYSFQYILKDGAKIQSDGTTITSYEGPTYTLGTKPFTVDSTLVYDYFIDGDEASFPIVLAPDYWQLGQIIVPRGRAVDGGNFPLTVEGGLVCCTSPILAEDDTYDNWMGAIRCRVRRIIAGPTLAFWRNSLGQ